MSGPVIVSPETQHRLAILLEARRDGDLNAAGQEELDRMLADPAIAAVACTAERMVVLLSVSLAPQRDGAELARAVNATVQAGQSRGLRVVRNVRRQLSRRAWAWYAAAAVLLLSIAATGILTLRPDTPAGGLTVVAGDIAGDDLGTWQRIVPGGAVAPGRTLRTTAPGGATVAGRDGLTIAIADASQLRVDPNQHGVRIILDRGALDLDVPPQEAGSRLSVRTPDATVQVVGTRFHVSAGAEGTDVAVAKGIVQVTAADSNRLLRPGETLRIAAAQPVDPRWGDNGLRGIRSVDDGWLAASPPRLLAGDGRDLGATWTATAHGGRLVAADCIVEISLAAVPEGVLLSIAATRPMPGLRIVLCTLAVPPTGADRTEAWTRDDLAVLLAPGPRGSLAVVGEAEDADLSIAIGTQDGRIELRHLGTTNGPWSARIALGVASGAGEPPIIADRIRAFAVRHPLAQRWGDLRRLGMFGYAGGTLPTAANPNCWFGNRIDVRTAEGRATFRDLLIADADAAISGFRTMRAQGVVLWGLEGSRYLNDVGFIADPRRLAELAPEMDAAVDELFARFSAAGLRTGMLIRPWRLDLTGSAPRFVRDPATAEQELADRIAYARARWKCTLFVIMFSYNGSSGAGGMPPDALRRLAARFPDITLVSDSGGLAWLGAAGAWDQLSARMGDGSSRWWRRTYPAGRSILLLDGDPAAPGTVEALRSGLRDGGVPILWLPGKDAAVWASALDEADRP